MLRLHFDLGYECCLFWALVETYQAMLWFSNQSIIKKKVKMAILEYFSTCTEIMGNHSKLYISLLETSGKLPFRFSLLPIDGVMNQSETYV